MAYFVLCDQPTIVAVDHVEEGRLLGVPRLLDGVGDVMREQKRQTRPNSAKVSMSVTQ